MSAESDLVAALGAHAPLQALINGRVSQDAALQEWQPPYVVFTTAHTPEHGLDGTLLADQVVHTVQVWAVDGLVAASVANAVEAAATAAQMTVTSRSTAYDDQTGFDAVLLTIEDWIV